MKMNQGRKSLDWPPSEDQAKEEGQKMSLFEFDRVLCGDSSCTFLFKTYKYPREEPQQTEATNDNNKSSSDSEKAPWTDPSTIV